MTMPAISIRNLTFRYEIRDDFALRDVSLDLLPGKLMLVAGASGCGKSTLMRCINGLIPYMYSGDMTGEISVFGESTQEYDMVRMAHVVGTLLQNPANQIVSSHVRNEVAFGLENLGLHPDEIIPRVEQVLEDLNISHLVDRETFTLSGGEKQMVALAGILVMEPKALLLDEPLSSLDPASSREALEMFRVLASRGIAIMLVEHRVDDVLAIEPDSVVFMDEGKVTYSGGAEGMLEYADYNAVKLPAETTMRRSKGKNFAAYKPAVGVGGEGEIGEELLRLESVNFRYRDELPAVLDDVSLTINKGDIIALLGPNGAGKTTLVKHTLGLLKPTEGQVLIRGKNTMDITVAQAARTIGYVFQDPGQMLFAPSVREELEFGPKNLEMNEEEIRRNVGWALKMVNLSEHENDSPLALSYGQQKRVSIAAILSMRSRILLMDEPTAGQDYWNYRSFMDRVLQMEGFDAVVFITHDLDLAVIYANRVIILGEGRILADGPTHDVLKQTDMLIANRIVPTSLLKLNLKFFPQTGRYASAQELAQIVE